MTRTRNRKPARDLKKGDVLARGGTVNNVTLTKRHDRVQVWVGKGHPVVFPIDDMVWVIDTLAHDPVKEGK